MRVKGTSVLCPSNGTDIVFIQMIRLSLRILPCNTAEFGTGKVIYEFAGLALK